jgi:tRNA (cmo5U34)-methyltransferase
MSHSVRRHLRLEIADYDATIRRWIPGYETMLSVAAEAVASVRPEWVVDLGSGTGALAQALLERPEVGVVELLDVDPEMLEQARTRVDRFGDRAVFTLRSFAEPFGPCNAFAASLSLHHIPSMEAKADLFRRVFAALRPGGVFVNADATMPADEAGRAKLFRYWADHQMEQGIPEEEAFAHFDEWSEEDTYMPLEVELAALRAAGFDAGQVWASGPIGVVVAKKRGG